MSNNLELDRLKAKQQSLFERKQAAFQRFKWLQEQTNKAYDVMQAAWSERTRTRVHMNNEYEARKAAFERRDMVWDGYGCIPEANGIKIFLWYNNIMYLSESERKEILSAYDCEHLIDDDHYQVEPDTWVYLFHGDNDKKYILIDADYIDFDFEVYPHLLRFNNGEFTKSDFVLQREIPVKDDSLKEKASGTILFEYKD